MTPAARHWTRAVIFQDFCKGQCALMPQDEISMSLGMGVWIIPHICIQNGVKNRILPDSNTLAHGAQEQKNQPLYFVCRMNGVIALHIRQIHYIYSYTSKITYNCLDLMCSRGLVFFFSVRSRCITFCAVMDMD